MWSTLCIYGSSKPHIEDICHFLPRLCATIVDRWNYSCWTNELNKCFQFIIAAVFAVRNSYITQYMHQHQYHHHYKTVISNACVRNSDSLDDRLVGPYRSIWISVGQCLASYGRMSQVSSVQQQQLLHTPDRGLCINKQHYRYPCVINCDMLTTRTESEAERHRNETLEYTWRAVLTMLHTVSVFSNAAIHVVVVWCGWCYLITVVWQSNKYEVWNVWWNCFMCNERILQKAESLLNCQTFITLSCIMWIL